MDFKPIYEQKIPVGPGLCSFCGNHYSKTNGMVEGPNGVFICIDCCQMLLGMMEHQLANQKSPTPGGAG